MSALRLVLAVLVLFACRAGASLPAPVLPALTVALFAAAVALFVLLVADRSSGFWTPHVWQPVRPAGGAR